MPKIFNAAVLSAAFMVPLAIVPSALRAADDHHKSYHDEKNKDEHEWNAHEDKAYRIWAKENHRKYRDFSKLKEEDRQSYWGWRHDHDDTLLKINIR